MMKQICKECAFNPYEDMYCWLCCYHSSNQKKLDYKSLFVEKKEEGASDE
jgi:hypothetical protein